jgi:hypothetical protein
MPVLLRCCIYSFSRNKTTGISTVVFEGTVEFLCLLLPCTKEINCVLALNHLTVIMIISRRFSFFLSDNSDIQFRQPCHLNGKMVLFLLLTCVPLVVFISLPALARLSSAILKRNGMGDALAFFLI